MTRMLFVAAAVLSAATAAAHEGVKNPDVKARMDLMVRIAEATKTLGNMMKGAAPFDAAAANAALDALAGHADAIPSAFESAATDPKSEARPAIWDDWAGFVAASESMRSAADTEVETLENLRPTMAKLGRSCGACHETYRIEN